ncbi:hypothetical protein AALA78_07865 [Lachnospiraceae bacterium 42-17]|jgi:hypothetical protein|nr:hypothetical protein [Dorea sp.]
MSLARDEFVFLIVLAVNFLAALIYLLAGIFLVVPARASISDTEETEILYDNRRTYLIRFIVMILCPVIVPLFFFMGHLFYLFVFWRDANLTDVVFSKKRVKTNRKADEEVERNIIPLEEAILVNEKKDLRTVLMNVMSKDIRNSLASITLALESEDSETSHYAAAVLSDELNKFRIYVQKLLLKIKDEDDSQTDCEEMLIDYMNNILKQHIFSEHEQRKFVISMTETAELLYEKDNSRLTLERCEAVCLRLLELKDYEKCEKWCLRVEERYPDELAAFTCKLKLYFAKQDRDAFFETLDALKKSDVVIDSETLELIRIFSIRRQ